MTHQFETSEVMQEYVRIMAPPSLTKEAASYDWGEAILSGVAVEAAVSAGAATALALGVSGTAAKIATGLLATGPWGVAAMALILGGAIIWEATRLTDDNLDDLIERFEDLDPKDESTEKQIEKVVAKLNAFKEALGVQDVPESPEEKARQAKAKLDTLTQLTKYLDSLRSWFDEQLKANLDDWSYFGVISGDAEQARFAIDNTLKAMMDLQNKAAADMKAKMQKAVQKYGKTLNTDLAQIGAKVKSMYNELTQLYGAEPKFDNASEQKGYALAEALASKQATLEDVKDNAQNLIMLHGLFEKALAAKRTTGSVRLGLSKRALTLGDGTRVTLKGPAQPSGSAKTEQTRPMSKRKNNATAQLQRSINFLNNAYGTGIGRIKEDGIYGPNTQAALEGFLNKYPQVKSWANITTTDAGTVRKNPAMLNSISQALGTLAQHTQKATTTTAPAYEKPHTSVEYGGGQYDVAEQPQKWNPTGAEILAALSNKQIEGVSALTWMANRGFNREQQIALAKRVFTGPRGIPPASEWSMPALKSYIETNYRGSLGRHQLV